MVTVSEIEQIARNYLRDFPKFFQLSFDVRGRTYELGHPNIDTESIYVAYQPTGASTAGSVAYSLDARNGLIRVPDLAAGTLLVEGYHYEWLTKADLSFYAQVAINMHTHNTDIDFENLLPAVRDVIGIDCLVEALWGLVTEFSRDIDVMTSESIHIPASQRFRMVESLLQFWMEEYKRRAKALNIGLDRIEVFNLRRISRTTYRYVPVYKGMELGDYSPIERLWIPVDNGQIALEDTGDKLRETVYVDTEAPNSVVPNNSAYY